ncbi:MAG: transcription elongation factor GreA [Bacteroidales bacterium]|jgi:transcription elongation factor GreA|nr:transcription elongation factor GreA [Bacteroidales bacterium]
MGKISYVTEEGLLRMKKELEHMINVERPAISKQIAEARDKGDLSENAEYDAAKDAQGMLEARIHKLEETIRNSRILDESRVDTSSIQILNRVKLKNLKNNSVVEYLLVSESEANLKEGKIAITTPIGKGLIGKKVGDTVEIQVPAGKLQFNVLAISR